MTTRLQEIISWLLIVSEFLIFLGIAFVAFRMLFADAEWKTFAPIFWGTALTGAALLISKELIVSIF